MEVTERIKQQALQLQKLLQENILKDPELAKSGLEEAAKIRDEIQSMGFLVTWESGLQFDDSGNPKCEVVVKVWKPKENLSPEDQKIYDEWFAKINKIKPPN